MSKKKEILEYIKSYINEKGYSPTIREIGKAVGLQSTSAVSFHLVKLRKEGKSTMRRVFLGQSRFVWGIKAARPSSTAWSRSFRRRMARFIAG